MSLIGALGLPIVLPWWVRALFGLRTCLTHAMEAPAGIPVHLPTWWGRCHCPLKCLLKYWQADVGSPPSRAFLSNSLLAVIPCPNQDHWQPMVLVLKDALVWLWIPRSLMEVCPGWRKKPHKNMACTGSGWGVWKPLAGACTESCGKAQARGAVPHCQQGKRLKV